MNELVQVAELEGSRKKVFRMRCRLDGADANTLLFFASRGVLCVANCRRHPFRRHYKVKRFRVPFYDIAYLGLQTVVHWNLASPCPGWVVVIGLTNGAIRPLSLPSATHDTYRIAVNRICAATGIRRHDPKL